MAHYAIINSLGQVVEVMTGRDEYETVNGVSDWENYYSQVKNMTVKRTSYNTRGGVHYTDGEPSPDQSKALRFNYAGVGFTYDADLDAFIPPKPFESWVLDEATCLWTAPIPYPADGGEYVWDEATTDWLEVVDETV